jgi:FkbM family methyltransferase
MMKKTLQDAFQLLGYAIVKHPKKSKKTNKLSLFNTKTGKYYLPTDAHQDHIANTIKKDQIFDVEIYDIAKKYIKPGTIALDVGSNFGQLAVLMSKMVGDNGAVHAYEADDFVFEILEKNIQLNSKNIIAHYGAVHENNTETLYFPVQDFERFGTYGSYGIDYSTHKGRPVKTIMIDDTEFDLPVSFIKVDVQGGDLLALKGARKTIEKYRMPIIFEYEWVFEQELNLCFQDYVDFVSSINYKFDRVINGQNYLILPK